MSSPAQIQWDDEDVKPAKPAPSDQPQIKWDQAGTPIQDTSTIGAAPSTTGKVSEAALNLLHSAFNTHFPFVHPLDADSAATESVLGSTKPIENYTQEGRAEHPILSRVGDVTRGIKELVLGGQEAGKPMGTSSGIVNNPVTSAIAAAPEAAELASRGTEAIGNMIGPSVEKAEGLSNRALFPRDMPVGEQPQIHSEFNRVARSVAPYTKETPLETGEGGALRGAHVARQAAQNIWDENVEPVVESYGQVRRPTTDLAEKIRGTVSDTDRELGSPRAHATDKLADLYQGQTKTVKEMADRVRELNNDKAVVRFQNMDANEQSQALLGDPSLRGKVAELNGLRDKMFDTISQEGGDTLGAQFQNARLDWGALRNYEDRVLNAKVPTPQPLHVRLANTVRTFISPRGVDFYARPSDTLGRLNNPNRLIPKALNMAGRIGYPEEIPTEELLGAHPFPPAGQRILPPIGGTGEGQPLREVIGQPIIGGHNTELPAVRVGESMTQGGKLARVEGPNYREPFPIESGPRTPVPPRQTVGVHEPASSISGVEIRAGARGRWQRVLDDPAATAAEKNEARENLRKLK
ncbi:hypothetical protein KGP36_03370 [Patescibacteria group bacterium]|nr:hypothetical protein [Patescibacteria group bacterium]